MKEQKYDIDVLIAINHAAAGNFSLLQLQRSVLIKHATSWISRFVAAT